MTDASVVDIIRDMVWCILKCSLPLLLVSLIIGLVISIFQTVTSIQEQTLTFVPKLIAILLVLVLTGEWIMDNCVTFFTDLCIRFSEFVGG